MDTNPNPKSTALSLHLKRRTEPESINRPQYKKWREQLLAGKPLRVVTSYNRAICFIPSTVFPDNGDMPEGTLIVCYGGNLYQGYVELDFTKSPNPFFLKTKGFPIAIGTLICQTIYRMFPHLNPLTEEDIASLRPTKSTKLIRLTAPKTSKTPRKKPSDPKTEEKVPEVLPPLPKVEEAPTTPDTPEPKTIEVETTKPKEDHATRSTKQQKTRRSTNSSRSRKARKSKRGETKRPDVQG